jgi:hypothetical protein
VTRRIAWCAALTVLALGVGAVWVVRPPSAPPQYAGPAPELRPTHEYVEIRAEVLVPGVSPEQVHAWTNAPDRTLQDIVQFDSSFPAVVGTEPLRGEWLVGDRVGDRRRVDFADGHHLAEQVLVDDVETFRYLIWGFTSPQRLAVDHGTAEFRHVAVPDGTRVVWTYRLLPRTAVVAPFVESFGRTTMAPMMRATLDAIRDGVLSGAPADPGPGS